MIVEELSGLEVNGDIMAPALVVESADVKRETVLLGTLGGAVLWLFFCFCC